MKTKSRLDESFGENKKNKNKTGETNVLVYSPKSASSSSRFDSWPLSFSFSWTAGKKSEKIWLFLPDIDIWNAESELYHRDIFLKSQL